MPDAVSLKAVSISSARSGVVLSSASERERRNDDVERNAPTNDCMCKWGCMQAVVVAVSREGGAGLGVVDPVIYLPVVSRSKSISNGVCLAMEMAYFPSTGLLQ